MTIVIIVGTIAFVVAALLLERQTADSNEVMLSDRHLIDPRTLRPVRMPRVR